MDLGSSDSAMFMSGGGIPRTVLGGRVLRCCRVRCLCMCLMVLVF